jgi:predicted MFS family arabinose efflux permease
VTPPERRGRTLGSAFAAAMLGTVAGPVLGALVTAIGYSHILVLVGAAATALAIATSRLPSPATTTGGTPAHLSSLRQPALFRPLTLMLLPCLGYGALNALLPIRFTDLGAALPTIALLFGGASLISMPAHSIAGRLADRHGRTSPTLWGTGLCTISLAALALPASLLWTSVHAIAYLGGFFALAFVPASATLDDAGRDLAAAGVAPALMLGALALGETAGALAGGFLGDLSAPLPYLTLALLNVVAVGSLALGRQRP